MKKTIFNFIIFLLMVGLSMAQVGISFPSTFTMSLPQLPIQQSPNQILFNCPYDVDIEHRITNVYSSEANITHINIEADVQYWTQDRKCAGSKHFKVGVPILSVTTPNQLANAFVNNVSNEFILEANSNRQPHSNNQTIISTGSAG